MRRHKDTWVQVNLRVRESLRAKLAASAEEHEISFNEEVRQRLMDSFDQKARQSLADFLADFERNVRDVVERNAREVARSADDIELTWRRLAALGASMRRTPTGVEEALGPDMRDPEIRKLVTGTPDQVQDQGVTAKVRGGGKK